MQYKIRIDWNRHDTPFNAKTFERTHTIHFDHGFSFQASSAPEFAGNAELPNPESLFTASLSSCLMLSFLYVAAQKGLVIDEYTALAIGTLAKNAEGKLAMTEIELQPKVSFSQNKSPSPEELEQLFKKAHDMCFISSSIKTKVTIKAESVAET
jgi:organic hydroperoxide reductase OsmC/OhrA